MIESLKKDRQLVIITIAAIMLKLIAMGLFSSDYQNKMFEPFIDTWISNWFTGDFNPYQYYYDNSLDFNFPYPAVMLFTMTGGELLCRLFADAPLFVHNILFKLPLLIFDFIGYIYLVKMFPERARKCCYAYMYSPITFYAVFMHGQLDIIPMVILFVSIYYLSYKENRLSFILSAVLLSFAVLAKLNIVAAIPLILLYIYKRHGGIKACGYTLIMTMTVLAGFYIFYGEGFENGVVFNNEQLTLFSLYFPYGVLKLYLSLLAIVIIYLFIFNINIINRDLLYGFCGTIFAVFLTLCVPMPGWYVWIVPFVSVFIVRVNLRFDSVIYSLAMHICYLIYFVFFHFKNGICDLYFLNISCSFLKVNNPVLRNISFTLLTGTLLYLIFLIYKFGITQSGYYRFRNKSFVIGICGDSGTGKSTLQELFSGMFKTNNILCIEGDGDHKWERGNENWKDYTHLDPKANYLYRQAMDIIKLKNGQDVKRVNYDHSTGKFTNSETIHTKKFIIFSGLHTLYLPQLREVIDLKIYMEAEEDLRLLWKMNRDSSLRGHSEEEIIQQIRLRYEDAAKFIVPQRDYADIIIHYFIDGLDPMLIGIRMYINTKIDIEPIVDILCDMGVSLSYEFSEDFTYQIAVYHPSEDNVSRKIDFERLASEIIDNKYDITNKQCEVLNIGEGLQKLVILKAVSAKLMEGDLN